MTDAEFEEYRRAKARTPWRVEVQECGASVEVGCVGPWDVGRTVGFARSPWRLRLLMRRAERWCERRNAREAKARALLAEVNA